MGVVATIEGNLRGFSGEGAVDEDAGVCGEGVLLAAELLAGVGDIAAVGAPAKVCDVTERAVRKLKQLLFFPKDIHALSHNPVHKGSHKAVGNLRAPMVPVAVH